jgi:tetratricopeptide (TPR) repeat protein
MHPRLTGGVRERLKHFLRPEISMLRFSFEGAVAVGLALTAIITPAFSAPKSPPPADCSFAPEEDKADGIITACTSLIRTRGVSDKQISNAYNNRGVAYSNKGQLDLAIADYTEAIKADPSDDAPFNNRGGAFLQKGDYDKAIADFSEVLKIDKAFISAYAGRGNAFLGKKDYRNAIADFDEVIRMDPTGGLFGYGAYMGLGDAYNALGDSPKAISVYTQAIGKVVNPEAFFLERGLVEQQTNDTSRAIVDYNEAVKRNPSLAISSPYDNEISDQSPIELRYALAFKVLGNGFLAEGNNGAAIENYDQAIKLYPQYAAAINNRGVALLNKTEYGSAIVEFYSAIKLNPKFAFAYNNRANAFFKLGKLSEALSDYTTALSLNPKLATALYPRALIEETQGDKAAATRDRAAAIALDPAIEKKFVGYKVQ